MRQTPTSQTSFPNASTRIARPATDLISADRGKAEHEEASQSEYRKARLCHHGNGAETFRSMFDRLPSAPNLLQVDWNVKFSVPFVELDNIMPTGWSLNTFKPLELVVFSPASLSRLLS